MIEPMLDSIDRFLARSLPEAEVRRRDEAHQPPYDLLPAMAELGLIRAPFAEVDGGLGLPWSAFCELQMRLGRGAYFAASIVNRLVAFAGLPILRHGSALQRAELLPRILDGRCMAALALTEPQAGSDARAISTRARQVGDGWELSGRKTWISDAGEADLLLTLCRDGDGHTAFLVPRHSPGVAMTPLPKVGNNCMPSFDIGFDQVRLPDTARLGPRGQGFRIVTGTLAGSRASMAAAAVGCAEAALALAVAHARDRRQFGQPIGGFQAIAHRLADMRLRLEQARLMVRALAAAIDAGEPPPELAAMAKVAATEALQAITDGGMQILASAGYAAESPMQRYWRDARLYSFGEGTNEIQRDIIARSMGLGRALTG